jgi:hypothetical protein
MARLRTGLLRTAVLALLLVVCAGPSLRVQGRQEFRVSRVASPPKIDGVLNDAAWNGDPLALGPWISYNPLRGETGPERTEVRSVYDDRYIYFAFRCLSDEPDQIRTTIGRRDNVFNDDWVGLSLDSTRAAYLDARRLHVPFVVAVRRSAFPVRRSVQNVERRTQNAPARVVGCYAFAGGQIPRPRRAITT